MRGGHAYIDESFRGTYTVCAVIVAPGAVKGIRASLRGLLVGGERRLHMTKENESKKKRILETVVGLDMAIIENQVD